MKKQFVYRLSFIVIIFFISAVAQSQQGIKRIRLDPDAALGGNASQFISKVNFIPLENTKESDIAGGIYQMEVTDSHFIIHRSRIPTEVLIFSKSGKFQAKVQAGKDMDHFRFDRKNNHIVLTDHSEKLTYDIHGKLVRKEPIIQAPPQKSVFKVRLNNVYTAHVNTKIRNKRDSLIYQLLIYKGDQLAGSYLPYPKNYVMNPYGEVERNFFKGSFNGQPSGAVYTRDYDYTVYQVTPAGVTPVYQFLFPLQYSLPQDFMDTSYNGIKRESYVIGKRLKGEMLISRLSDFYKTGNIIFFATDLANYAYDVKKGVFVCYNKLQPDSVTYYLPIDEPVTIGKGSAYLNKKYGFMYFDGTYFYTTVPAQVLFNAVEESKGKKVSYPPALEAFFKDKKNREGNRVIVQIEFKKGF